MDFGNKYILKNDQSTGMFFFCLFLGEGNTTFDKFDNKYVLIIEKYTLPFGISTLRVEATELVDGVETNKTEAKVCLFFFV